MIAFIAMKFDDNYWKDKRYLAITEVLEEAGYDVIRSDQIKSSGKVVDEVCNYFNTADLVLIDTTGDSHSVSYEVGYCHGINRDPMNTIIIRKKNNELIPFNYRHYRLQIYNDTKHMKKLIRSYFDIINPIQANELGYVLSFSYSDEVNIYGLDIAKIILKSLKDFNLSGRLDYFGGDTFMIPNTTVVCLGIKRNGKNNNFTFKETQELISSIKKYTNNDIWINEDLCELSEMHGPIHDLLNLGSVMFIDGEPIKILNKSEDNSSWFISAILEQSQEDI